MRYLEQYLEGEPKELIKGCLHLDSQNGYAEAMKLLVEKYGDPYKIANAYIKKVNDWPCIRQGDDQALDRFATFLTQCRSAMSELTFLVKTEAGIATDPVFSRESLSRLDVSQRPDRFNNGRNANKPRTYGDLSRTTSHVSSHATTVVTAPKNERCDPVNLCEMCGKSHDLDDCEEYLKKYLQERREFLKGKELCFACYGGGHRSNGCAQRTTCKTCDRRHPTGLPDDNFRPNQPIIRNQNPLNEQSVDVVTTSHAETEEAVCSVVGTGNPVTAVPIVPVRLKAAGTEVLTYAMLDSCSTATFVLEDVAACWMLKVPTRS